MAKTWIRLGLLTALIVGFAGCWTTEQQIKPPPRPEDFSLPPLDDARFSSYPSYPQKTLNQGLLKKDSDPDQPPSGFGRGMGRPGGPGAMGGGSSY
jgi:hypothetical protein